MMNSRRYVIASAIIGFCAISLFLPFYVTLACIPILLIALILLGVSFALWINVMLSSPHKTVSGAEHILKQSETFRNKLLKDFDSNQSVRNIQSNVPQIFGRTVDSLLQQLLDFVIRDYIIVYLKDYAYDLEYLSANIKDDLWGAVKNLHEKFLRVDHAKLIACDVVTVITNHFEKIRESKSIIADLDMPPEFVLSAHVMSSDVELHYLRVLSEVFIMFLLPRTYSLAPTKYFLREVLCCKVFKPFVDMVTDPDFFNRNLINYIEKTNQQQINLPKKVLENVEVFIDKTDDIQVLKQVRYSIVTRLMQATTLQNLNRAKGVDLDNEKGNMTSSGIPKSDITAAKKLKKTINHLTMAKNMCDKKLLNLGCDLGFQCGDDFNKVLPLITVLDHILGRKFLSQFLQTLASHDLVRFWIAVEELRTAQRNQWHQLGAEIFYTFIRNPISEIKVDKTIRKRMESFLLGDKGPEVFYEVQQQVVQTIEDKYYQPFLISDYYKEMIIAMEKENDIVETDSGGSGDEKQSSVDSTTTVETGLNVGDHSNYARRKLDQLAEKLNNKIQALAALKSSMRPESKVLGKLENEVEWLQGEKRQLEAHLTRTEIWAENLGRWTTIVQSAEVLEEKEPLQFVLVVQMSKDDQSDGEPISTGWVVCRSLTEFQELHKKLRPLCSEVRNLELPSNTFKFLFGKTDKASLDKAKLQIQKYLDFVLKNDRLNQSEAVYSFLSPSSEHLKHSTPSPKKSRFSLSTIFKSGSEQSSTFSILKDNSEEDISQCLETVSMDTVDFIKPNGNAIKVCEDGKDSIAEPLYALLSELFDMRGVFKYVRKTLIGFVQVTYGRNINRQIYETISWWFSEEMLHYYVAQILKNFWPGGALAPAGPLRTKEERLETAQRAQEMLINNVPEILTTLVGGNAARNGAKKVFDALQEKNMNKQLFYEVLEIVLDSAFPEIS
ncbi:sorting nexin-25 isoform X1 [Sitophilus oryzae]|uniref:Sorting nexin-25 isoform X1 n=3 Tax=Sitophilus oryzae TaxID=7048 RepID=A0A6J2X3Y2_SITOR|nr:sorting nexin-25 isoform X1 [Sitophilus oryzae]